MQKGPYLVIYDLTNTERITSLDFGVLTAGIASQDIVVWLWNRKDFTDAPAAVDVRVTVTGANSCSQEVIDSKYLSVRSSGILDPGDIGIIDDAETAFTPIGGELTDPDAYHGVGDIPSNCARKLYFRLSLPEGYSAEGLPKVIVEVGFMSEPSTWLYV